MLSREDNERLTRVGPGTPMGGLLRRYWMPALLDYELPEPDCPPKRVRLLGEDLVAFRDTEGRVGIVDEVCAHRCASLFLGRNEESGLRCAYHGWKYDVDDRCVDMPNEPPESRFKERISIKAYPAVDVGGVIWAYMGPPEKKPGPPAMEWTRMPPTHRFVSKTLEGCSWLQGLDGGMDPTHQAFLHNNNISKRRPISDWARVEYERTPFGFHYAGIQDLGEDRSYVRIRDFVMPFQQMRPHQVAAMVREGASEEENVPQLRGHLWVPIDDENMWVFNWIASADKDIPLTPEFVRNAEKSSGRGADGEVGFQRLRTKANDWLIDREMQRTVNFTGIPGVNTQDVVIQESMGPIVHREREHLGGSDRAVIILREVLLQVLKEFQEGVDPPGADPETYRNVRPIDLVLPKNVRWQDAAAPQMAAAW